MSQMHPFELLQRAAQLLGVQAFPGIPNGLDVFLPFLERMRDEGAVVALKWDGERHYKENNHQYTVVVSGQILDGDYTRCDSESLELALARAVVWYATRKWGLEVEATSPRI